MAGVRPETPVPSTADARLRELADILALGILRMAGGKSGLDRGNPLGSGVTTRPSVLASEGSEDNEVT